MIRLLRGASLFVAALLLAAPAGADTLVNGRFVSKTGMFSIDMHLDQDQTFHLSKESTDADVIVVDFLFTPGASLWGLSASRTIEWFKLAQPIAAEQSDGAARDVAESYLTARYPTARFQMQAPRKARTAGGQLYYVFAAEGLLSNTKVTWRGAVLVFDSAIGLVAQLANTDAQKWGIGNLLDEPLFLQWATTLRPEK